VAHTYFVQLRKRRTHYPKKNDDQPLTQIAPAVVSARASGQLGGQALPATAGGRLLRGGGVAVRKLYGRKYFHITQKTKQWIQKEFDETAKDGLMPSFLLFK
jgi:hypothetical protein